MGNGGSDDGPSVSFESTRNIGRSSYDFGAVVLLLATAGAEVLI